MPKTCSHPGCVFPAFSKGLCIIHWKMQHQKPLKRTRIKKSVTKIAYKSDNKKKQDEEYHRICEEMDAEARANDQWVCFFCGKPLSSKCDHHHVAGKQGLSDNGIPLLLDKDGLVLSHRSCHREYHDIEIAELLKAPYYEVLMEKILYVCKSKYHNMKLKQDEYV